jgi:hypothetical protein
VTATRPVALNANDKLYVSVLQRNSSGATASAGNYPFDLTFDVLYLDKL